VAGAARIADDLVQRGLRELGRNVRETGEGAHLGGVKSTSVAAGDLDLLFVTNKLFQRGDSTA